MTKHNIKAETRVKELEAAIEEALEHLEKDEFADAYQVLHIALEFPGQ